MSRTIYCILTVLVLWSCASEPEMNFTLVSIANADLEACQNKTCPEVVVDYETMNPDHPLAATINAENQKHLAAVISTAMNPDDEQTTVDKAIEAFVSNFQDFTGDFPEAVDHYELDIQNFVAFKDERWISYQTEFYTYTGGAHGYGGEIFLVLDASNGTPLTLDKIIEDMDGFIAFAEAKFRKQHDIPDTDALNSHGFWFDDDQFYVSETFGFIDQGLVINYLPYEIASWAQGLVSLEFSWEEINRFL